MGKTVADILVEIGSTTTRSPGSRRRCARSWGAGRMPSPGGAVFAGAFIQWGRSDISLHRQVLAVNPAVCD